MNLTLRRYSFTQHGIFGRLYNDKGYVLMQTLEHSYPLPDGGFAPKVPAGTYTCVRGMHRLEHMITHFQTFEITNVPGHSDILFHTGNTNEDSAGCVLVGLDVFGAVITKSHDAFQKLLDTVAGVDSFNLTVKPGDTRA